MSNDDHSDPAFVIGAVLAQVEDLEKAKAVAVLEDALAQVNEYPDPNVDRAEYLEALAAFVKAGVRVLEAFPTNGESAAYPPGLPSFDDHVHDLLAWRDAERDLCAICGDPCTMRFAGCKQRFVVRACHDGTDWGVYAAGPDDDDETLTLAGARDLASKTAKDHGCRWFDFSGHDEDGDADRQPHPVIVYRDTVCGDCGDAFCTSAAEPAPNHGRPDGDTCPDCTKAITC